MIGHTPVVRLRRVVPAGSASVLVKLEYLNPTGSSKDRMARAIIEGAERRGDLRPGMSVVECTGGSTGSSLAFVCAQKGYPLRIVTSDAFAPEKLRTIAAFGGELMIEPSIGGQIAPDLIPRMIERAKRIAEEDGAYPTDQFHNEDALVGYREIVTELLPQVDTPIDAFCGGIGTGGMVAGISRAFRERGATTEVVALEPASSPMLSEGRSGSHHIEGVGIGFVPPMVHDDDYARVFGIEEAATRSSRPRSTREEGIFAGTSSGMNVVTVAVDFGLKYLAGDLFSP
ncbi:MAG: cysteine synthase family protein [Chloroflexota bacterium]|nr:cysteine synthase family protein [Chloroflexota bacterium]